MSHVALRRLMVRLLHDPSLVETLYRDPEPVLAPLALSGAERDWLLRTPPAAWRTDPDRPTRVLHGLRQEFQVALQLSTREPARFFASPEFHDAVQTRGSLADAFAAWLAQDPSPQVAATAAIEGAIARVRRAPRRPAPSPAGTRRLTPDAALVDVPAGTLGAFDRVRAGGAATPLHAGTERLLAVRADGGEEIAIEELPDALAAVLRAAVAPAARDTLLAVARAHGAEPGEDEHVIADLEAQRLLM